MQWRRGTFAVHRWMGLVVSLQLLAWSVGGFVFSILDIDNVRGDLDKRINPPPSLSMDRVAVTPWVAHGHAVFGGVSADKIARIVLKERFGSPVYDFYGSGGRPLTSVDAVTGELRPRVPAERVAEVALADFVHPASVTSVTLLEGEPPSEYRGGVMPVYQVILDHPKRPHLYICPVTGKVLKRRNRPWRVFDFFWMLHIMDYRARESFNHYLLTTMSGVAVLTSASGLALWAWRLPIGRRRRRRRSALQASCDQ